MNKRLKKITAIVLGVTMSVACLSACGGGGNDVDETKTQLSIACYQGGQGSKYLENTIARFEEKYKDHSFEEGKVGVAIELSVDKKYDGQMVSNTIGSDLIDIYCTNSVSYYDYVNRGLVLDLTELIKETTNVDDGKTIYSKMPDYAKEHLEVDGKYYMIPLYEMYSGLTYDAALFEKKNYYLSDVIEPDGTRAFVQSKTDKKSPGPDGKSGTYDDGLPSSYKELYKLIEKMKTNSTPAFCWTGAYVYYSTILQYCLFINYLGADAAQALTTFDSNGKSVKVIDEIKTNGTIVTEDVVITKENANKLKNTDAMFYALQFAAEVFGSNGLYYYPGCTAGSFNHTEAQRYYMNSGLNGKEAVGMLIEGNYWYNEAADQDVMSDLEKYYPETYTSKDVKWMPLPIQFEGTVTEGNGRAPVLAEGSSSFSFINAKIEANKIDAAKTFLSFLHSDNELKELTKTNGLIGGLNYDYESIKDECNSFTKSVIEVRNAAKEANSLISLGYSSDPIYIRNRANISTSTTGEFWAADVAGTHHMYFYNAIKGSKISYIDYFKGMQISDQEWGGQYLI